MNEQDEMVIAYNNLDINQKRKELADEFTELVFMIKKLQNDVGVQNDINTNEDLKKLFDGISNEEKYMTGLYVNILNLKDELGLYLNKIIDLLYEEQ